MRIAAVVDVGLMQAEEGAHLYELFALVTPTVLKNVLGIWYGSASF